MANNDLPSPQLLRKLLDYDPETGFLTWRERERDMFPDERAMKSWNTRNAGKRAFITKHSNGYLQAAIFNTKRYAHRVIWAMAYGEWPQEEVDHINGDKTDNRLDNLRAVTRAENARNSARSSRNTSGVIGVSWCNRTRCWVAQCRSGDKWMMRRFKKRLHAIFARKMAERKFGFHANHGR